MNEDDQAGYAAPGNGNGNGAKRGAAGAKSFDKPLDDEIPF
jgi:hypothetical protein